MLHYIAHIGLYYAGIRFRSFNCLYWYTVLVFQLPILVYGSGLSTAYTGIRFRSFNCPYWYTVPVFQVLILVYVTRFLSAHTGIRYPFFECSRMDEMLCITSHIREHCTTFRRTYVEESVCQHSCTYRLHCVATVF